MVQHNGERDQTQSDERTPLTGRRRSKEMGAQDMMYFEHEVRRGRNGYNKQFPNETTVPLNDSAYNTSSRNTGSEHVEHKQLQDHDLPHFRRISRFALTLMILILAFVLCLGSLLFDATSPFWSHSSEKMGTNRSTHFFDDVGRYILQDYDSQKTFSDFLPGLAGVYGKPLYAFYINRGQAIASFGIQSKEYPIMEFETANKAYQSSPLLGFRTFIQGSRRRKSFLVEPFSPLTTNFNPTDGDTSSMELPKRTMYIGENELQLQEVDPQNQLETNVTYFVLPEEDFGAFVRRTTVTNIHRRETVEISLLDGLARMQPAGGKLNEYLKNTGSSLESYMGVDFPYEDSINMPFYRLTTQPSRTARVQVQERGHYCFSFVQDNSGVYERTKLLPIVFDTNKVFGEDTTLLRPTELFSKSVHDIVTGPQYGKAKTSSCFAAVETMTLQPGETLTISTIYGATDHILNIPVYARRLMQDGFILYKLSRTREIIRQITASVSTRTSHRLFDAHVQQMFLDNSLRGGIPLVLGDQDDNDNVLNVDEDPTLKVFHVFSRTHGDLERDYSNFMLSPTFFSEGPGNFRDVAQNRREDVVFNPRIGSFDVRTFLSYIQADGYEPLSIEAVVFTIPDREKCDWIAERAVGNADGHRAQREALSEILAGGPFRPGQLFSLMEEQFIEIKLSKQTFIDLVATNAETSPMAVFETGFWADHWTYYMDIINSYLSVFPDGEEKLMYETQLPYFFSPGFVQPRSKKYILSLSMDGYHHHVRQLDAMVEDSAKVAYMEQYRSKRTGWYEPRTHWHHSKNGTRFESAPASKLFLLATLKFATRDAYGMGIEYEGGRPGWDDGNNGLPGMLVSGMPETYELKVLLEYLLSLCQKYDQPFILPVESEELISAINTSLGLLGRLDSSRVLPTVVPKQYFKYWDQVSTARENYREKTKINFSGEVFMLDSTAASSILSNWLQEVDAGIERAFIIANQEKTDGSKDAISPTYFSFDITGYEETGETNSQGHPLVKAKKLAVKSFPLFLEGPTRMMKTISKPEARHLYHNVRASDLYDKNLSMLTVSTSLEGQSIDIGRSMAIPSGWMENQSIWLHMSYKFYLELLRQGLYEEFFSEITSGGLLPFMDADKYGRSLLECSSFLVSSAFEDPSKHGRGYLPRLSGSTAEFLSTWVIMFIGPNPFFMDPLDNELRMYLRPALPAWLFEIRDDDEDDPILQQAQLLHPKTKTLSFKLFSSIHVHYYNMQDKDLKGEPPLRYRVGLRDGSIFEVNEPALPFDLADKIRRVVFVDFIEAFF